jgi:hypothetical protein
MKKIIAQGVGSTYVWCIESFKGKYLVCEYRNDVFMCVIDTYDTYDRAVQRINDEEFCKLADSKGFPSW